MGEIYGRAAQVRIWLGPLEILAEKRAEQSTASQVLEMLSQGTPFLQICQLLLDWPKEKLSMKKWYNACENEPRYRESGDSFLSSISSLYHRPWWGRVWVMQEVVLASNAKMQWGSWIMSFDTLLSAYHNLKDDMQKNFSRLEVGFGPKKLRDFLAMVDSRIEPIKICQAFQKRLSDSNHTNQSTTPYLGFVQVLATTITRQATDPRDKVYGVLAMAPPPVARAMVPNYDKTISEVYVDTAYHILHSSRSYILLHRATSDQTSNLPS